MESAVTGGDIDYLPPQELPDQDLYHSHSWWTTYVFSQDAKYIGVQYALTAVGTGLIGLVLSWLMRLQLAFPGLGLLEPGAYYQFVTMHGMIMVVYLLTALFLGGFGNYLIPLMCGSRDMAFPYVNMLSYWSFVLAVVVLLASFFIPGGPTGAGWTLYPPQAITAGTPGYNGGIVLMLISLILFVFWIHDGWIKLYSYNFTISYKRNDLDENAFNNLGYFYSNSFSDVCISCAFSWMFDDDIR